jgi:uncharacterized protein
MTEALTRLAGSLAAALQEFAAGAGRVGEPDATEEAVRPPRPSDEHALGKRQRQLVEVPELATEDGIKTADLAAAIDYEVPNTYTALQSLARAQVVEQVPDREPQHWRLTRRYRGGNQAYARMVSGLAPSEWTTAADVSIAVRGDVRAAESILRAGLSHRVLADAAGRGLSEAGRRQLAADGVTFLGDGRPAPEQRLTWDELQRRETARRTRGKTVAKGTLNYIQIPTVDLDESATFYEQVFGWQVTRRPTVGALGDQTSYPEFVDSSGQVGGGFVLGRRPSSEPGILPCIGVDSIDDTLEAVVEHGGAVVKPRTAIVDGVDWEAVFHDPAGNALGLFEQAAR